MHVLFIHPAYPNQFTDIAHYMGQIDGIECSFLTDLACSEMIRQDNVPIVYYGYSRDGETNSDCWYTSTYEDSLRHGKGVIDTLDLLMKADPPDVVIGHASFGVTFFIKEFYQVPVVSYVELPGYFMSWCRDEYPAIAEHRFLHTTFQSLIHNSVLRSDLSIVPSGHAKQYFPKELQPKIRVQMEGFTIPDNSFTKQAARKAIGLAETGPVIGFAGRTLEAVRGFDIFIKVAKEIRKIIPDSQFLVIGSEETIYGNEQVYLNGKSFKQHVLEQEFVGNDFCVYKGYLEYQAFQKHLQAMDLIYFPQFEGAANWGVFEAMAAGVPVIASDKCFIPEVIQNGVNGYLFDPYAIEKMAQTGAELLLSEEKRDSIALNAQNTITQRYSVESAVAGYLDIIDEVI